MKPHVTVGEVIRDVDDDAPNHVVPNVREKTVERIETTMQGETLYESYNQNQRLDAGSEAPTIMVGSSEGAWKYAHPTEDRPITNRERARLQTFPDWYTFVGGRTDVLKQTGNAVPPKLAEAIAGEIREVLLS